MAIDKQAFADDPALGAPPPDAKALVEAPKGQDIPKIETPTDETTGTASAGAQIASGNSKLIASTANGKFELRRGQNGFGASLLANYGESAQPGQELVETTENIQGRIRYDRFFTDRVSAFLIGTGREDRFQGVQFRGNLDPGVKYLFYKTEETGFWVEAGYDLQYDLRFRSALAGPPPIPRTQVDNSGRLFLGFKHSFNPVVTVTTGLEFLQSFVDSSRTRLNYDALFAAQIGGGLSVGLGFSARYDYAHLPGKLDLDTSTTLTLIYSFSETPSTKPGADAPPALCVPATPAATQPPPPSSAPPLGGPTTPQAGSEQAPAPANAPPSAPPPPAAPPIRP